MARQLRIEYEGSFYHVTSRGNMRERIFFQDRDREKFLEILMRTRERYGYLLHAYALMDNHYHLLIETPKANLSQIMQNINTSHTVYVNKKYGRNGHLFQGRFKGIIVDKDAYLITLSKARNLNPVRAGMVDRPEDYRWTSYRDYMGESGPNGFVVTSDTLGYFSNRKREAVAAYRAFAEAGIGADHNPFREVDGGCVLGSPRFKEKVRCLLKGREHSEELPQLKRFRETVPMSQVIKACCGHYGRSEEELVRTSRGNKPRDIAIYLAKVMSGRKNKEVGALFGIKGPAVSGVIKAVEGRLEREPGLRQEVAHLKERMLNEL